MVVSDAATMTTMARIPEDILHYDIFPWLPCKTISRFKVVCKKWYHLFSHDEVFARKKLQRESPISSGMVYRGDKYIDFFPSAIPGELNIGMPDSFFPTLPDGMTFESIVAFVDGLLLAVLGKESGENPLYHLNYVWDLVTKEGHIIPGNCFSRDVGLAFDPSATPTRYTLVNIKWKFRGQIQEFSFDIYSSSTRRWTASGRKVVIQGTASLYPMNNICIRNIIYWNSCTHLLWFDLEKDVAGNSRLPPLGEEGVMYHQNIGVAGDDQGILTLTRVMSKSTINVWAFDEEGEWVKSHTISTAYFLSRAGPGALRVFRAFLSKGGDVLYLETQFTTTKRKLLSYNIVTGETTTISELKSSHRQGPCHYVFLNHNSLIRFKQFG
ncbi:unnamed protein product [Musa textilis]